MIIEVIGTQSHGLKANDGFVPSVGFQTCSMQDASAVTHLCESSSIP